MTEEFRQGNNMTGLDRPNQNGWGGIQKFRQINRLKKNLVLEGTGKNIQNGKEWAYFSII